MSISVLESPRNWELISSTAITGTPASISLTSFGTYKDILVLVSAAAITTNSVVQAQPNSSATGAHYFDASANGTGTFFSLSIGNSANPKNVSFEIHDVNTTQPSQCFALLSGVAGSKQYFMDTNAVTSVLIYNSAGTFNNAGTIYLYGRF
jgi:hypothetical protein